MERQRPIEQERHPDEVSVFERYTVPTALTNPETLRMLALEETRRQLAREQRLGTTPRDPYVEQLQDRADELRMTPREVPQPSDPKLATGWLGTLKEKWVKKLKK